eukprot:13190337-Ditylum_brightwellii.AAC.1
MTEDLDNWWEIVAAVEAMEDCILAESAFLLLFPLVEAIDFVTVRAIMTQFRYDNEYRTTA